MIVNRADVPNTGPRLDAFRPGLYRSASPEWAVFGRRRGYLLKYTEDFDHVAPLRSDRQGALVGHKVSHSNIKTKRRFLPNLLNVTLMSDALGRSVKLRISANALKTVDHRGGLDAFLEGQGRQLSPKALKLKREIEKKAA